ncbi:MAG: Rpn family recombination-promoting nuclease/putative transposase [Acetatifactor sp.]|nr:Rpn family recombination-promoting nuclease/putative transposase [Acetatifactor sp.]
MKKKLKKTRLTAETTRPNRRYKDTVFRMLFRDRTRLLGLYNAVTGNNYQDPTALEIVTLESTVYLGVKNDIALLIDLNLYLFEHQSTVNPNMPLRFLQYVAAEYGKLTAGENLYGGRQVLIPVPHFMVFYNGTEPCPERVLLRLSDAYGGHGRATGEGEIAGMPELELIVQVLNINAGCNEDLKTQCQTLGEYMRYVDKVRLYARSLPIGEAVDRAVDECIDQGILREFLLVNKAEVRFMSIFEYDEEETRRAMRKTEYERGMAEGMTKGKAESVLFFLEKLGAVPEYLQEQILSQQDLGVLQQWLQAAAVAKNIESFMQQTGL